MKRKAISLLLCVAIIIICILASNYFKAMSNRIVEEQLSMVFPTLYRTVIGSVICLLIGMAVGYIIRVLATVGKQPVLFRVFLIISAVCMVCMILVGIDMIFASSFSTGFARLISTTFGVNVSVFIMQNGRLIFLLLGLLDMLFWPMKKEKNLLINEKLKSRETQIL